MEALVLGMEADDYWQLLLFLLVATVGGLIATFLFFHRARIIEDTPTSKIKSAAQGYVEFEGTARDLKGIEVLAKLTCTPCVWFSYKIERYVGGKNSRWVTEEEDESKYHFILEDETGQCLIYPVGAAVTAELDITWYGHSRYPEPSMAPTQSTGLLNIRLTSGHYRYTEKRIHAGDALYALGDLKTYNNFKQVPSLNDALSQHLKRLKSNKLKLFKDHDKDNNGTIDMQEWQEARNTVLASLEENYFSAASNNLHVMDKPKERRHPYLLSAFEQDELAGKYKTYSWLALATFFSAGAISTFMITVRLMSG